MNMPILNAHRNINGYGIGMEWNIIVILQAGCLYDPLALLQLHVAICRLKWLVHILYMKQTYTYTPKFLVCSAKSSDTKIETK